MSQEDQKAKRPKFDDGEEPEYIRANSAPGQSDKKIAPICKLVYLSYFSLELAI